MTQVFKNITDKDHEQIVYCNDPSSGLKAIIAIHSTALGPALGGCRMYPYKNEDDALIDVLRLSRGMTYKASIANLNLGGGKAVIIGDPKKDKSEVLLRSFGKFVDSLNGKYITAEDVNTTVQDIEIVSSKTKYVSGLPSESGGSGDPSPFTSYGVYLGMKATALQLWGKDNLSGKKISVQGTGKVGKGLIEYLVKEGAELFVTDINQNRVDALVNELGVHAVGADEIYDLDVDIYSPCALGATINDDTIKRLQCSAVVGAANNQLSEETKHIRMLMDKGILYAPDFLVNAGGVINCYTELEGYNKEKALKNTEKIYDATLEIYKTSIKSGITTLDAAMKIAEDRIESIRKAK